jgi:hypothetical protein
MIRLTEERIPVGSPQKVEAFLAHVDRVLEFFAAQVEMNLTVNGGASDPLFHEKAKRRAVRALLGAVADLET